ncbi:phosphate acyltransferase PlsX [Actinoplanes sp. NPDC023936]|uniref:phosphate acyltransferase PlsX n=1 Tax=Actinoplanes sp. NPDC023936 TaxID=3154910 RepID=UPI0033C7740F
MGATAPGQRTVGEPGTARIAVDLLGGDHAPAVVVDGALRAVQADPALHLTLVGPAEAAGSVLAALDPADRQRITTTITSAGTVRGAAHAVAQGRADALVSAGDTGATVLSAARELGRWPGVRRPALAAALPTAAGRIVLLDVGSSVDPDAETLVVHACLGAAYASVVHGVAAPRVGLLTIGTEPGKGDRLRRALPPLLAARPLPAGAGYAGLVEGGDVVLGASADVVVTDGFTGNVLLKGLETGYALAGPPQPGAPLPPRAAVLLGVNGTVVVCHGAASGSDLAAGIAHAADLYRRASVAAIADLLRYSEVSHD